MLLRWIEPFSPVATATAIPMTLRFRHAFSVRTTQQPCAGAWGSPVAPAKQGGSDSGGADACLRGLGSSPNYPI